jgi:hypothetical protein
MRLHGITFEKAQFMVTAVRTCFWLALKGLQGCNLDWEMSLHTAGEMLKLVLVSLASAVWLKL